MWLRANLQTAYEQDGGLIYASVIGLKRTGAQVIQLSTFLGHANPASSAVYLTITDNLLVEANKRFEQFARVALEIEE